MKRYSFLFPIIAASILVACQPSKPQPVSISSTEATLTPLPITSVTSSKLPLTGTATPPMLPVQYLEFSDLSAAQKAARFPLRLPGSVPDDLPFYKAWISDYADRSENVRLFYQELGDPINANLKSLDIQTAETNQPLTLDSINHQFRETQLDLRQVEVRGQDGYSYWIPSEAAGNSAVLIWREGTVDIRISLSGDWPQPDASHPHALEDLLLKIAGSLQTRP